MIVISLTLHPKLGWGHDMMAEPILKAAIQISFLLAKSFFTGFSLTILALLARLRVLVQQTLLDVVVVFNKVSSLSQKKHAVKLTQGFIEAFREYYPSSRELLTLECAWEKDKFVLLERKNSSNTENQNEDQGALPLETSIKYEIVQFFSEVQSTANDQNSEEMPNYSLAEENFPAAMQPAMTSFEDQCATISGGTNAMDSQRFAIEEPRVEEKQITGGSVLSPRVLGPLTEMDNEAAFIPMRKCSEADSDVPNKKIKLDLLFDDLKADGTE